MSSVRIVGQEPIAQTSLADEIIFVDIRRRDVQCEGFLQVVDRGVSILDFKQWERIKSQMLIIYINKHSDNIRPPI